MISIDDYAKHIWYSSSLKEKLLRPNIDWDLKSGLERFSSFKPGRDKLLFSQGRRHRFPKPQDCESDESRSVMLHHFANHELQAIELIAWGLLRFRHLDISFKKRLLDTLVDEQQHLEMYISRMRELGLNFGDIALNSNFVDQLRIMDTPLSFMNLFALTFEGSNLDFCLQYAELFKRVGDNVSAQILKRIYADEIKHVAHGVDCLKAWKQSGLSDWDAYVNSLSFPVTPRRAKGPVFNKKGRKKAGMSDLFLQRLLEYDSSNAHSKIFYGNFDFEYQVGLGDGCFNHLNKSLSYVFHYLSSSKDYVVGSWTQDYLEKVTKLGFNPGKSLESGRIKETSKESQFYPWGWSEKIFKGFSFASHYPHPNLELLKNWVNKTWLAKYLIGCGLSLPGTKIIFNSHDVKSEIIQFAKQHESWVIKPAFSVAGRNQWLGKNDEWSASLDSYIKKNIHNGLVIQPWYHELTEISIQGEIGYQGKIKVHGLTRQLNLKRNGCWGIQKVNKNKSTEMNQIFERVSNDLKRDSYQGPFSVDFVLMKERIFVLEVHPRFTMGRIGIEIFKKIKWQCVSWLHFYKLNVNWSELEQFCDGSSYVVTSPESSFPSHLSIIVKSGNKEQHVQNIKDIRIFLKAF